MATPDLYVSCVIIDNLGTTLGRWPKTADECRVAAVPRKGDSTLIDDDVYDVVDVIWDLPDTAADRLSQSATLYVRLRTTA
jgi:hypothetical protein